MNRVICSECSEVALESIDVAERLEGLAFVCCHCHALGRVVAHDNDEGGIGGLELVAYRNELTAPERAKATP